VTPEHQGDDLRLGRGVAVIVAGQVPPLPAAVREPVLPVVLGAEDPVQAEEQQDQDDARGQAQSSHPGGRDKRTPRQKAGEREDPVTSPRTEFEKHRGSIKHITGPNFSAEENFQQAIVISGKLKGFFLMGKCQFQQDFQTFQGEKSAATQTFRKTLNGGNVKCITHSQRRTAGSEGELSSQRARKVPARLRVRSNAQ